MSPGFFLTGAALALMLLLFLARPVVKSVAKSFPWFWGVFSSDVPSEQAIRFGDFISITGFILTVLGIVVGWKTVTLDNARGNLESQMRDVTQNNAELQQKIRETEASGSDPLTTDEDVHLDLPARDSVLTSTTGPEFHWHYTRHKDRVNYFLELVDLDFPLARYPGSSVNSEPLISQTCDFEQQQTCRILATDPAAQRTEVALAEGETMSGHFLWRVLPAMRSDQGLVSGLGHGQLAEWSEYGSFEIYPNLAARVKKGRLMVGTTYSDNVHFSSIQTDGMPAGHDIDLIRLLIGGCLLVRDDFVAYDSGKCREAAAAYPGTKTPDQDLPIKAFPSVEEGLQALRRKEIDVFVGAVTKAREREHEGVRFTDGYYPFHSVLYTHGDREVSIGEWARTSRTIGVIANSTNHWLATALSGESSFGNHLTIVALPSYWALRSAFENREINGVLIDSVLGYELATTQDAGGSAHRLVTGLQQTDAWKEYQSRLGYDDEEFAIAVASDDAPQSRRREWLTNFFYLPFHGSTAGSRTDLYAPLQSAIRSNEIQSVLARIRIKNDVPQPYKVQ